jgi:hypothetical protein
VSFLRSIYDFRLRGNNFKGAITSPAIKRNAPAKTNADRIPSAPIK